MTSSDTAMEVPAAPKIQSDPERRFVLIVSIAFVLVMTLPYLWVWTAGPLGYVWGGLIGETFDSNVHLAWARQARDGAWVFRDLFTTESLTSGEKPLFVNVLPLVWGKLALTGIPIIVWFHLTRVAAGVWALWEFYKVSRKVLPQISERKTALYLVAFTTGASVLGLALPFLGERFTFIDNPSPSGNFPTMPETFLFTSAFLFPLNIVSYGLMAFLIRKVLESEDGLRAKDAFFSLVGGLLLANIHTYDAIPLGLTIFCWMIFSLATRRFRVAGLCCLILVGLAAPTLYQATVFRGSEEFRIKALTPTPAPRFRDIFMSLLPLFVLAPIGFARLRKNRLTWLILGWAVIALLCIYAPVSFARKMIEGAQLPLVLLAGTGLIAITEKLPNPLAKRYALPAVLAILTISPLYFVKWDLDNAAENNQSRLKVWMPPQYLLESEWGALRFLDGQTNKETSAVLSLPFVGAYGPRETGLTFYLSHWAETLYYDKKTTTVSHFYRGKMSPNEVKAFFRKNHIRYVIESPYERALAAGSGYQLSYELTPVWQGGTPAQGTEPDLRTIVYAVPMSAQ